MIENTNQLDRSRTIALNDGRTVKVHLVRFNKSKALLEFVAGLGHLYTPLVNSESPAEIVTLIVDQLRDGTMFDRAIALSEGSIDPSLMDNDLTFSEGVLVLAEWLEFNVANASEVMRPLLAKFGAAVEQRQAMTAQNSTSPDPAQ